MCVTTHLCYQFIKQTLTQQNHACECLYNKLRANVLPTSPWQEYSLGPWRRLNDAILCSTLATAACDIAITRIENQHWHQLLHLLKIARLFVIQIRRTQATRHWWHTWQNTSRQTLQRTKIRAIICILSCFLPQRCESKCKQENNWTAKPLWNKNAMQTWCSTMRLHYMPNATFAATAAYDLCKTWWPCPKRLIVMSVTKKNNAHVLDT